MSVAYVSPALRLAIADRLSGAPRASAPLGSVFASMPAAKDPRVEAGRRLGQQAYEAANARIADELAAGIASGRIDVPEDDGPLVMRDDVPSAPAAPAVPAMNALAQLAASAPVAPLPARRSGPAAQLPADVLARLRAKGFTDDEIRAAHDLPTSYALDD